MKILITFQIKADIVYGADVVDPTKVFHVLHISFIAMLQR